jgi:small ligand-binding sensory domain FIST
MLWASAISTAQRLDAAVADALDQIERQLDSQDPDLVIAFVTSAFGAEQMSLRRLVQGRWNDALLFGCCASGVIGAGREIEQETGVAISAAILPGVEVALTHVESSNLPPQFAERTAWEAALQVKAAKHPQFLLVTDPFTFSAEEILPGLDRAFPGSLKVGGLASGGRQPGSNLLYLGHNTYRSGAIFLALSGNVHVDSIVAQGCRPIGDPMFVTACHGNLLRELDGQAPRDVLSALFDNLSARDRELVGHSLSIGFAMPGQRPSVQAGDFLIRNVLGMDPQTGSLWVGAKLEANSIVQFHVRDALSSAEDLERALSRYRAEHYITPAGALLFSCVGRGSGLYGSPDHDSNALRRSLGDLPIVGFFCSGEIGPVQGFTQVHGYTSAVALISPKAARP